MNKIKFEKQENLENKLKKVTIDSLINVMADAKTLWVFLKIGLKD